jgi:hypothetical protein
MKILKNNKFKDYEYENNPSTFIDVKISVKGKPKTITIEFWFDAIQDRGVYIVVGKYAKIKNIYEALEFINIEEKIYNSILKLEKVRH